MSKRIIICCDGTWNTADQREGETPKPTNVAKMAQAISPQDQQGTPQIVYYGEGVGTDPGLYNKVVGGMTGKGISANIIAAYRFLVNNYVEGDELFFFGFSRGAYTVRSLAGLVRNCGILKKMHVNKMGAAYDLYRSKNLADKPDGPNAVQFIMTYSRKIPVIKFIGVWDTVGALGIPNDILQLSEGLYEFHDVKLSQIIANAYHALAIDENRKPFLPTLWEQNEKAVNQKLEQVWFAGVHSDIGGGYVKSGLSDISFQWMKEKVAACGLGFEAIDNFIFPDPFIPHHNELRGIYLLIGKVSRPIGKGKGTFESIHESVMTRRNKLKGKYAPDNLIEYLSRQVQTPIK